MALAEPVAHISTTADVYDFCVPGAVYKFAEPVLARGGSRSAIKTR